jgi:hypothetical protein
LSLFEGRSFDQHAWLLPIYRLTGETVSTDFEWLDQIPRPVTDEDWTRTGLQCWADAEFADARTLVGVIGRFKALTDHLSGWLALARREDADREVLQGYVQHYQEEWSRIIQALIDALGGLAARYVSLSPEEQARRPYLAEAVVTVREHYQHWLPPGLGQGEGAMSVAACESWLSMAAAHIQELHSVGAAVLIDSMSQAAKAAR